MSGQSRRTFQESYERMFEVLVSWSRCGDLFAYDETAQTFSAQ